MTDRPAVILTTKDFALLDSLVLELAEAFPGAVAVIRQKLRDATLSAPEIVPADVVTLNSRVRFTVDGGAVEERVLTTGPAAQSDAAALPLNSPRGIALVGARAGQSVVAQRADGSTEQITITEVTYQPERKPARPALRLVSENDIARMPEPVRFSERYRPSAPDGDDDPGPSAA